MKKYKIGNRIITADSPVEAIKVSKMLDSANKEIEYLTKEEEQAVEDYRNAIAGTTNPKLLELYKHILDEELEHIRELQEADVEDSVTTYRGVSYEKKNGFWVIKHKGDEWAYPDSWSEDRVKYEIDYELDGIKDCSSKTKDDLPPYEVWVKRKKNGPWLWNGSTYSKSIAEILRSDRRYADVIVLERGKEPTKDCDMKDAKIKGSYTIRNGAVLVFIDYKLVGTYTSIQAAKDAGHDIDSYNKF